MSELHHYIVTMRTNPAHIVTPFQMSYEDAQGVAGRFDGIITNARWYDSKHGVTRAALLPVLPRE